MNKRQAKKAFKKKYGVNPNKVANELFKIDIKGLCLKIGEMMGTVVREYGKALQYIADDMNAFCQYYNSYNKLYERLKNATSLEEIDKIEKEIQELQSNYNRRHNV